MPYSPPKRKTIRIDDRQSAAKRGYDRKWANFRQWFLRQHPLCEDCDRLGIATAANEVHHKIKVADDPDKRLVPSNCLALCKQCHSKRTARGE